MKEESINTLLDAFFEFIGALLINTVLYILLFYAVYKTVTSLENQEEVQKWMKYWIFYGIFSFICSYLEHGTLIKTILCGIMLLKFNNNVILHASYDIVLSSILKYSSGYILVLLGDISYGLYRIIESIHWTIITTCNISDEVATESVRSYEKTRGVIMKRTKQTWEEVGSDILKRLSRKIPKEDIPNPPVSMDDDKYERLSRTCIVNPIDMDKEFSDLSSTTTELRKRK